MSESEQEHPAEESGIPASPGHHGGPVPSAAVPEDPAAADGVTEDEVDEAGAGHPHGVEPRAGRDE